MEISPLNVNVFNVRAKQFNYIFDQTQHGELISGLGILLLFMLFIVLFLFFSSGLIRNAADSIFYSLITPQHRGQTEPGCLPVFLPKLPSCPLLLCDPRNGGVIYFFPLVSQDDLLQTTEATVTFVFTYLVQTCLTLLRLVFVCLALTHSNNTVHNTYDFS